MKTPKLLRRKAEGITDYRKRLELLKSEMTRLVIRETNKGFIIQGVDYGVDGDKVLTSVNSNSLSKITGKKSNNTQAYYLAGYLCGKLLLSKGVEESIVDIGRQSLVRGGRLAAAMKGAVDAGLLLNVDEEIFPDKERLEGKHLKSSINIKEIVKKIDEKVK